MSSRAEWRVQRKVSVKLEIEQDKLPIMNNREGKYAKSYKGRIKKFEAEKAPKGIMAENSPTVAINISLQIQEAEQTLNSVSPKKFMPRCMIIKLKKTED